MLDFETSISILCSTLWWQEANIDFNLYIENLCIMHIKYQQQYYWTTTWHNKNNMLVITTRLYKSCVKIGQFFSKNEKKEKLVICWVIIVIFWNTIIRLATFRPRHFLGHLLDINFLPSYLSYFNIILIT